MAQLVCLSNILQNMRVPHPVAVSGVTAEQKQLVRASWAAYNTGADVVGDTTHIFVRLFNTTPAALFSFVPGDALTEKKLLNNSRLRSHVQRLAGALNSALNNLENIPNLMALTRDLGARHACYGVQERFFKPVVDGVMYALNRKLGASFTTGTRQAWTAVLDVIVTSMQHGLREGKAASHG